MKRIIYAAIACLTLASCEDFLDKQPIEKIGTDEYFKLSLIHISEPTRH